MDFLLSISSSRVLVWPFWMPFIKSKSMTVKESYVASILPFRCLLWLIRWIHVISQLHERINSINNSWHLGWIKIINPWPVSWTLPMRSCLFHVPIRWWCSTPLLMIVKKPSSSYVPIKFMPSSLFKMPLADRNQDISGIPQVLVRP